MSFQKSKYIFVIDSITSDVILKAGYDEYIRMESNTESMLEISPTSEDNVILKENIIRVSSDVVKALYPLNKLTDKRDKIVISALNIQFGMMNRCDTSIANMDELWEAIKNALVTGVMCLWWKDKNEQGKVFLEKYLQEYSNYLSTISKISLAYWNGEKQAQFY